MSVVENTSQTHLLRRLRLVESRVRAAVARRRTIDPDPEDRFRGLYVSSEHVDQLLDAPHQMAPGSASDGPALKEIERLADQAQAEGHDLRLRSLARGFSLADIDVEILLIALAPDLDARFERLYGYLNDDVTKRRATIGLALELCGADASSRWARACFAAGSRLLRGGLVLLEELERPFLTRSLRVPDRIAAYLVGDDAVEQMLAPLCVEPIKAEIDNLDALVRALREVPSLCYVRERAGAAGMALAATAFARARGRPLVLNLNYITPEMDVTTIAGIAGREARLGRDGLVAGPVDALAERGAGAVRAFADLDMTVVLVGSRVWDPAWSRHVPLLLDAPSPTVRARSAVWRAVLNGSAPIDIDPALATEQYRLTPDQIARAADAARLSALAAGRRVGENDIRAGARAQNAAALERLARRIVPVAQWDSLVLPSYVLRQLRELVARAKQREMVLDTWGMGRGSVRGRGITALFAGDSGTGKTLAAEVVAADLGLDVYSIDLATVVDKYIGETEKNLDRIFGDAERINGVLLFDEADALFGRRSGVRDARDRYANVEVAYLLQRMEMFEGIAILATNLRANMDEAFGRRLDVVVDFPFPEEDARLRLWEKHLSPDVPRLPDVDLAFLARAFRLAGGNIRNITLAGAFFAAAEARPLGMEDLIRGTEREYRKLGRLCLEGEFGPYFEVLNGPDPARAGKSDASAGC